jgi:lysophospholipase L1-like esterase
MALGLLGCSAPEPTQNEGQAGTVSGGAGGAAGGGMESMTPESGATSTAGAGGAGGAAAGSAAVGGQGGSSGSSGGATAGADPGGAPSGGSAGEPALPACEANQAARCTGTSALTCDFAGEAGDYVVTLDLGGPSASTTYVEVEANRRMLGNVELVAGETRRFAFGVNVRHPEGQPVQSVPAGNPGLQLYLRGDKPQLSAVCVQPLAAMPKVWIAGDSTVCDQSDTSYAGWGQHLPQHFAAPVVVANYADSGESSASVLASAKLWGAIKAGWKPGDWVLVQVGHNDKTVTTDAFRNNMTAFVTQAKAADVHIVLFTPISRANGGSLDSQHRSSGGANIPQIIREVAQSQSVPLVDLTTLTWNWLQTVDWHDYFALGTDATHPNQAGAGVVAELVRDAIREQQLELAKYLR